LIPIINAMIDSIGVVIEPSHENLSFWISIEEFREQYYDSDTEQNNQLAMVLRCCLSHS